MQCHDDVIKWKHFPRHWQFVRYPRWIPHTKGQWREALVFSLICVWTNGWVNSRKAGDLRRYHAHYDIIVMVPVSTIISKSGLYVIFGTENARDKIITRGNNNVILTFWN